MLLALLCACGDNEPLCVEERVDIAQGVYGLASFAGDVGDPPPHGPLAGLAITATIASSQETTATAVTDVYGVFQLALPAGTYELCDEQAVCGEVQVPDGLVRVDVHHTLIGGWYPAEPRAGCD